MTNLIHKGKLIFHRDAVGKGHYGKVFDGRFEDAVDVTIVRVDKSEIHMDTKILRQTDLHPNIIRFYGAVEDDEFQFIASEMCGGNLKQLVRGEYNIPPPHAPIADKEILRQITCGLQYLHEKNICHRDLKPSNIFISRPDATLGPQLKLGNSFGFNRTAVKLPLWKLVGMSKCWVAPDIYNANVHTVFTKAMDVFALGLVFAFVLTGGIHAFGTEKEEIVLNIKKKKPMSFTIQQLKDATDGAAAGIYELISSMLSFNPDERPSATGVFNYTFFGKSTVFIPSKEREIHTSSFQIENGIQIKREPTTNSEESNDGIPETTGNNVNRDSMPPLIPIRLPSGESLPKKMRQEEEFHQQLPTPPLSDHRSSPFLRDDVDRCLSRTSVASSSNVLTDIQSANEIKRFAPSPPQPDCIEPSTSTLDLSSGEQVTSQPDTTNDVQPQVRPSPTQKLKRPRTPSESNRELITGPDDRSPSKQRRSRSIDRKRSGRLHEMEEDLVALCKKEILTEDDLSYFQELVTNKNVDINYKRKLSPPLLLLCQWNRSESLYPALQMLLERDDLLIDATSTNCGYDALMFLCKLYPYENLLECATLLIDRGISTRATEKGGKKALNILWERKQSISKKLANIIKSRRERPPPPPQEALRDTSSTQLEMELMDLCSLSELDSTQTKRFRLLVSKKWLNLNCLDAATDRTPLLLLCYHNQSEQLYNLIQYLLGQKSVNPHAFDGEGQNALLIVCFRHRGESLRDVIDLLLRYDVQVNCTRNGCWNALFALTCDKNGQKFSSDAPLFNIVKTLVNNGLQLNAKLQSGNNILVNLTLGLQYHPDFPAIIRFLVSKGVDPNAKNGYGEHALIILCKKFVDDKNLFNIMRLFIDCGSNVFVKNRDGLNALDILRNNDYAESSDVVKFLKSQ